MKKIMLSLAVSMAAASISAFAQNENQIQMEQLQLTQEWDKLFPRNLNVNHRKVTFNNRYGITLAADMYTPKDATGKLRAIAVAGPFGAVKEQSSGLYAQEMASRGFVTIAFDPSFTGESGGVVRDTADPAINSEDFAAAVDFLSVQDNVDPERIGIIGICGWGGFALNEAAIDTRVKATVTSTMYDMTRVTANGYFDATTEDERYARKQELAAARTSDFKAGAYSKPDMAAAAPSGDGEEPAAVPEMPQFVKDYMAYYAPGIGRAFHPRAVNFSRSWVNTSTWNLYNMPILRYTREIRSAVLMIHGEKAHSRYFSEDAYKFMTTEGGEKWAANKELLIIPGAVHTDLYDKYEYIPFDKIRDFFETNL